MSSGRLGGPPAVAGSIPARPPEEKTMQLDLIEHARRVFERGEMLRQRRAEIARLMAIRNAKRAQA